MIGRAWNVVAARRQAARIRWTAVSFQFQDPVCPISLVDPLRRAGAVSQLLAPEDDGAPNAELMLHAPGVSDVDVVTGVAMRMRIARHLRKHADGGVTLVPPRDANVAGRLLDLLAPLPERVAVTERESAGERARFALLPATAITDPEDAHLAGELALEACEAARIGERRGLLISLAVAGLAENALMHAEGAEDAPVLAATVTGRERLVEVAVLDAGIGISEASSPRDMLARIPSPLSGAGLLPELLRLGKKFDLSVRIEVLAGNARLRWLWNQHRVEQGGYVWGTTIIATINP